MVSVAAVDSANVKADFSQFNSAVDIAAPGVDVLSTYPQKNDPLLVGSSSFAAIPIGGSKQTNASAGWVNGGLCQTTSTTWRNKIVLCQRGTSTFVDKITKVQSSRALGVVIYNNVDGELRIGMYDANSNALTTTLPGVGISKADGEAILAGLAGQTMTVDATPSLSNTAYQNMNGTSMAAPHVSGAAAVVWSAKPTATAAQVRDALLTTAQDIDAAGYDNNTGWGLVQTKSAIDELLSP
ncbi:hypothetical protein ASE35_06090 [Lysobacter sp. Root916]|nr:hypothetical protein ASE35_06090 [Lysobacter sp. Root916]